MKSSQRKKINYLVKTAFPSADCIQMGVSSIEVGIGSSRGTRVSIRFTLTHTSKTVVDFIKQPIDSLTQCKSKTMNSCIVSKHYTEDMLNHSYVTACVLSVPHSSLDKFIETVQKELKPFIDAEFYADVEEVLAKED